MTQLCHVAGYPKMVDNPEPIERYRNRAEELAEKLQTKKAD